MSRLTVIKVGGSLLDWPPMPRRLADFRGGRVALIAGGGRAADVIRDLDHVHRLGDERSHGLALHALDLTARVLAALVAGAEVVDRLDSLAPAWARGAIPVLSPRPILERIEATSSDRLRASWEVTSDTIAARIAAHLGADELVLLKSAPLPTGTDRASAARLGLVDPAFPAGSRAIGRVTYLNLRDPRASPTTLEP